MATVIELCRTPSGALQLSISELDEKGNGHGFRIFGPKFRGDSELVQRVTLDEHEKAKILAYLKPAGEA